MKTIPMKNIPSLRRALTVALPIAAVGFCLSGPSLHAAVLVGYNFGTVAAPTLGTTTEELGVDGTAFTTTTTNGATAFDTDGVNIGGTTRNSGTVQSGLTITNNAGANGALPVLSRPDGHTVGTAAGIDVDTNTSYFSFLVTANTSEVAGATFNLTDLQLDYGPGGSTGRGFVAAFATNGSSDFTQIGTTSITGGSATATTMTHFTFAIPGATDLTSAEFRIFTFASNGTSGFNQFYDNFTVNGEVIPEPSSLMLLGGGILGGLLRRRRA